MFAQKGYSSMYEANQINGVYFAGLLKPKAISTTFVTGKPTPGQITMNTSSTPGIKMLR